MGARGKRNKLTKGVKHLNYLLVARLKRALAPPGRRRAHTESDAERQAFGALTRQLEQLARRPPAQEAEEEWSPVSPPTPEPEEEEWSPVSPPTPEPEPPAPSHTAEHETEGADHPE